MDEYVRVKKADIVAIAEAIKTALGITSTFKISDMPTLIGQIADSTTGKTNAEIFDKVVDLADAVEDNTEAVKTVVTKYFEYNSPTLDVYEINENTDKTFVDLTKDLTLKFGTDVKHGYISGFNIIEFNGKVVYINNQSTFDIKLVKSGTQVATISKSTVADISYHITANIVRAVADCDGANLYLYLTEVDDE